MSDDKQVRDDNGEVEPKNDKKKGVNLSQLLREREEKLAGMSEEEREAFKSQEFRSAMESARKAIEHQSQGIRELLTNYFVTLPGLNLEAIKETALAFTNLNVLDWPKIDPEPVFPLLPQSRVVERDPVVVKVVVNQGCVCGCDCCPTHTTYSTDDEGPV